MICPSLYPTTSDLSLSSQLSLSSPPPPLQLFSMGRADFDALPVWKQQAVKKQHRLF